MPATLPMTTALAPQDAARLRETFALAAAARAAGRHPFAALVTARDGTVIARATNRSIGPGSDATGHAELEAVREASRAHPPQALGGATLYSSAEPCAMCAGAIYWAGIGRVVYGLAEAALLALTRDHPENPTLALPCREVFARGQRPVEVIGPALADEARAPHAGFWSTP